MPDVIHFAFVRDRWPRANQRHLTFKDVDKLRQLVKARPSDKPSNPCDPRIIRHLVNSLASVLRFSIVFTFDDAFNERLMDFVIIVYVHRSELQKSEGFAQVAE